MSLESFFPYPTQTVEYLGNVSDRFKYFFLANPKVASTTVLRALQSAEVDGDASRIPEQAHDRLASPILSISTSQYSAEDILGGTDFFRFAYVRNPFTRTLSAYLEKVVHNEDERERLLPSLGLNTGSDLSFLSFLTALSAQRDSWRDIHWATQSRLIQPGAIDYHFIGRFESFNTSFPAILTRLGVAAEHLDASNFSSHATNSGARVSEHIGPRERELILSIYDADFANFGYGRDPEMAHL